VGLAFQKNTPATAKIQSNYYGEGMGMGLELLYFVVRLAEWHSTTRATAIGRYPPLGKLLSGPPNCR